MTTANSTTIVEGAIVTNANDAYPTIYRVDHLLSDGTPWIVEIATTNGKVYIDFALGMTLSRGADPAPKFRPAYQGPCEARFLTALPEGGLKTWRKAMAKIVSDYINDANAEGGE